MILSKLSARITRAVLITSLLATGLVPAMGLLAPVAVSAAPCNGVPGGGGAGGFRALNMQGTVNNLDSAVKTVGVEFTPQATWNARNYFAVDYFQRIRFAGASCADANAGFFWNVDGTNKLNLSYQDFNRTTPYVLNTDYKNVLAGVTVTPNTNAIVAAAYNIPIVAASVPQLITTDLSTDPGWVDVFLKTGSGSSNLLISFLAPAGVVSFLNDDSTHAFQFGYSAIDSSFTSCGQVTGSSEVLVRALTGTTPNGLTPAALTATPTASDCSTFDKTSYNSTTMTASLKYDIAGAVVNHVIKDAISLPQLTTTKTSLSFNTTLNLDTNGIYFKDYFSPGSSSAQQLFLTTSEYQDGKALPKNTPWPIAGGIFDLSTKDVDLVGNGVVLDTSATGFSAVAHNMNKITKDGTFTLFVPYRDGDKFVGLCAGAADIAASTSKCTGIYYLKDGQTKTNTDTKSIPAGKSVKATIITVGTKKFWQVDGLTGTGGFSSNLASDPATGIAINTTTTPIVIAAIMGTLALAFVARRLATVKAKK